MHRPTAFPAIGCRKDRGFTLVELLVVIAIISIIAGFLVPTLLQGRGEALKVQCANNLKELGKLSVIYSDSSGTRFFPYGRGTPEAHDSLNELVKYNKTAKKLNPKLFMCPTWRGTAPEVDPETDKYELDAESLAYTWTNKKLSPTDAGYALSSDKFYKDDDAGQLAGHDNGMNVLYTDISVQWVLIENLDGEDGLPEGLTR